MNKDKIIFADGTEKELEAGASLGALQVAAADRVAMVEIWEKMTPENLATLQIKNGTGLVVGNYTDLVLVSETSVVAKDGSVLTTYSLREKTSEERRMDELEAGQEIQDGAIAELAETVGGTV